ncbi:hypothetical protein DRJ19_00265 [Candidatus Woesearchaeota archaeon]|nr:MAG: hypothetical protein DRJ19_00265 [Candidatus Woesearchaeota archaeon]
MIKLIIFDWDKTLYDSKELPREIFAEMFNKKGREAKAIEEFIAKTYGLPIYYGIKEVYKRFLKKNPTKKEIRKRMEEFYNIYLKKKKRLFPGCRELLKILHKKYKIAIISGHATKPLRKIVYNFLDKRSLDYVKGSPAYKSTNIRFLMNKFKVKANEVVLVGDSLKDLEEALKTGIYFIGIANDKKKREVMLSSGAHAVIKSLKELPNKINMLGA